LCRACWRYTANDTVTSSQRLSQCGGRVSVLSV